MRTYFIMSCVLILGLLGCAVNTSPTGDIPGATHKGVALINGMRTANGVAVINGMRSINGVALINGMRSANGVALINGMRSANGVAVINGMRSINGVAVINGVATMNNLVQTEEGREVLPYLVGCALPADETVTLYDENDVAYEYYGAIGVAPEWKDGTCNKDCQEWISACLLTHVNQTGEHVEIWLTAENEAIDWGLDGDYPREEGAYFGNLFLNEPVAYACKGVDADVDPIPGRLCLGEEDCPYVDAAPGSTCESICDAREEGDGYTECTVGNDKFKRPISVFTH